MTRVTGRALGERADLVGTAALPSVGALSLHELDGALMLGISGVQQRHDDVASGTSSAVVEFGGVFDHALGPVDAREAGRWRSRSEQAVTSPTLLGL